ncbi:hypothetical protein R69888_05017 [Paraburkholderia haematera]|uniref:Uncharacterized protein n=1 Tax=Paraburkholderia haematera TaxID=2793077 RepID=A0ABM8S9U8_9BURK|nr:hypothetical protein R69888_05017 [Paraburkholderia haematera]
MIQTLNGLGPRRLTQAVLHPVLEYDRGDPICTRRSPHSAEGLTIHTFRLSFRV